MIKTKSIMMATLLSSVALPALASSSHVSTSSHQVIPLPYVGTSLGVTSSQAITVPQAGAAGYGYAPISHIQIEDENGTEESYSTYSVYGYGPQPNGGNPFAHLKNRLYAKISAGLTSRPSATNEGSFLSNGNVGATNYTAGDNLSFKTKFDQGFFGSAGVGTKLRGMRAEAEILIARNAVKGHESLTVGTTDVGAQAGTDLSATSSAGSISALLNDGQGKITTTAAMLNAFADIDLNRQTNSQAFPSAFSPYIGGGVGIASVDIDYKPNGVELVNQTETSIAYQLMAGVNYQISPKATIYGGYRYLATPSIKVKTSTLPGEIEVPNSAHIGEIGVRFDLN